MTRKPQRRKVATQRSVSKSRSKPVSKAVASKAAKPKASASKTPRADDLDVFIAAAAKALDLPTRKAWLPAVKANLKVTLQLASAVTAFDLPDDAEPGPVFRA